MSGSIYSHIHSEYHWASSHRSFFPKSIRQHHPYRGQACPDIVSHAFDCIALFVHRISGVFNHTATHRATVRVQRPVQDQGLTRHTTAQHILHVHIGFQSPLAEGPLLGHPQVQPVDHPCPLCVEPVKVAQPASVAIPVEHQ